MTHLYQASSTPDPVDNRFPNLPDVNLWFGQIHPKLVNIEDLTGNNAADLLSRARVKLPARTLLTLRRPSKILPRAHNHATSAPCWPFSNSVSK